MCDQTEVSYLENDVVWVKIGPIWWPGVVKDLEKDEEGREILLGLKKKPIATVKFFQEDNYEFVKNLDHIYHYNCSRKDEFIKKGLDKFRSGATHMKKFPSDVTTAETLVHGDINIVNDPKFYPEKKQSYSEIFGSTKKKTKKDVDVTPKSKMQTSSNRTSYRPITHQRFINKVLHGESDHKVRTLIQPASSPEDMTSGGIYKCHVCKFETTRVNVIVAHHRLVHSSKNSINWIGSDSKGVRRKPVQKSRKTKAKKLFESPKPDSSDDESLNQKKLKIGEKSIHLVKNKGNSDTSRKGGSTTPRKRKTSEDALESYQKRPRYTEVLLADWNEEDEDEKKVDGPTKSKEEDEVCEEEVVRQNPPDSERNFEKEEVSGTEKSKDVPKNQNEKMSCFDFDEEEEGFIGMSNANTYGRKIPRVIPVKDKLELGVDLEIGELFKRKGDLDIEMSKEDEMTNDEKSREVDSGDHRENMDEKDVDENPEVMENKVENDEELKSEKIVKRRRKSTKDQENKVDEESLAVRRTRRPGAKKSYLNEVIERIEDDIATTSEKSGDSSESDSRIFQCSTTVRRKGNKEDIPTPSRRKQDLKVLSKEHNFEGTIYPGDLANNEGKKESESPEKSTEHKPKGSTQQTKNVTSDDLTRKIDHLLAETNTLSLPDIPISSESRVSESTGNPDTPRPSTLNFSFDYKSPEVGDKTGKTKSEVKSITKMFSETVTKDKAQDSASLTVKDTSQAKQEVETSEMTSVETQGSGSVRSVTVPETGISRQLSGGLHPVLFESHEVVDAQVGKDTIEVGSVKKPEVSNVIVEATKDTSEVVADSPQDSSAKAKHVKTLKLKADSLPTTILSPAGKLKGQTIIQQKGGTYVILSQSQQLPRQKLTGAKGQPSGKLVILTNQHGEQKLITTSGLQQSKFKIEQQKVATSSSANGTSDTTASTSGILSVGKTQPVIKMVPDGKGGVMKQLTVSPKKVLLGGTKVFVSGGSTLSPQGTAIQKIALTSGNNLSGDYRLIENYKGSGKTVLIQGGANTSTGVLLKAAPGVQRPGVGETTPNIVNIKKQPKILMRAASSQNEFVVHSEVTSVDSPTYLMKRKGVDGKFSTQKIIRRSVIGQPKGKPSTTTTKTFFLSSDQPVKKADSLIIKTNHEASSDKIIRLAQKGSQPEVKHKFPQKIIQKSGDSFTVLENKVNAGAECENPEAKTDAAQVVQIAQNQPHQPILQTQVMAMPGPISSDGNQTYVLVSVDEHGVVQPVDNSLIAYDTTGQGESVFMSSGANSNVIVINPQTNEEMKPVFSNGSQDILAEALANTNVLEGNMTNDMESVMPSLLLPPSIPSSVVQETSITLQKPIMTPLEMPSSVAPDTSGLEPPPLPPTPTEEDVLMEDHDVELQRPGGLREEEFINTDDGRDLTLMKKSENQMEQATANEESYKVAGELHELEQGSRTTLETVGNGNDSGKIEGYYEQSEKTPEHSFEQVTRGVDLGENSQEEQGSSSSQSMPLLNDEPDTSDDAQGSEPIADQDFELQKSRSDTHDFAALLREQEPPSSTNNEILTESGYEKSVASRCDRAVPQETLDVPMQNSESEKPQEDLKELKIKESGETQSMPVISDDGTANSYPYGSLYVDALSQKRFQEETEVSSTTDEFSNKDQNVV